jgi:hypothetical protein
MNTKICRICNIEKNLTEFHFREDNQKYRTECKSCNYRKQKERNSKKINEIREYKREYFQKNKKEILEKKRNLRQSNLEKYKEETKKYYEKTKKIQKDKKKIWIETNREKYNSYWINRKKTDVLFGLITNMRARVCGYLKTRNINKSNNTFNIVGCSPTELKEHLEKQFVDGMNWSNRKEWHIDHIIPLSSAKTEEELLKLFHYTNLQPLWANDNIKKSNKIL